MQPLAVSFSDLPFADPALWLALGVGLVVMMTFLFFGRRSRRNPEPVVLPQVPVSGSPDWDGPFPTARHDERRRSIRRGGLPTPIFIVDSKGGRRARASEAYVLDRSTGGLRIAMEKPSAVGSTMLAKPGNAPEGFDWVKIMIRSCREVGDYYELGCQFESDLELSRLLMFG